MIMAGTTSTCTSSQCYRDPNTVRAPASLTFASPYIPQHPNIFMCSCLSSVCAVRKFDSRASATARAAAARAAAVRRGPSQAACRPTSLMPPRERAAAPAGWRTPLAAPVRDVPCGFAPQGHAESNACPAARSLRHCTHPRMCGACGMNCTLYALAVYERTVSDTVCQTACQIGVALCVT